MPSWSLSCDETQTRFLIVRVIVNTPATLVARHRARVLPGLLATFPVYVAYRALVTHDALSAGGIIGHVLGVATGVVIVALAARESEFRFDATTATLYWRTRGWRHRSHGAVRLADIQAVTIETNDTGDGPAQRVALITTAGRVPLTSHYSSVEPHEDTARTINRWLLDHGFVRPPGG